ncbi:MAG: STAS domain-containing protein [Armatimonadota bacterium]
MSPGCELVNVHVGREGADYTLVHVEGELDAWTTPECEGRLFSYCEESCGPVVVDLSSVGFIDSTGVRMLLQLIARNRPHRQIVLVEPERPGPRRALRLLGMDRVCPLVASVEEAVAAPTHLTD